MRKVEENLWLLIITACIVVFIVNFFLSKTFFWCFGDVLANPVDQKEHSVFALIMVGVIIAPLGETLITQLLPINIILLLKIKYKHVLAMCTSAILFGLAHSYNVYYIMYGFMIGFLFAYFFYLGKKYHNAGFAVATIAHAFSNTIALFFWPS